MIEFRKNDKAGLNSIYTPEAKVQEDREHVYRRYAEMKNGRYINGKNVEDLWDKWERQYESWRPPRNGDDWQSTIVPPFTTTVVERALAEIIDQTIQPMIIARGPEDTVRARVMNYVKDFTWEIGDGDLNLYSSIKQALILGKTVWQEDYWQDKRQVRVLKKFDMEKNTEEYEEKTIYDFDDVYGECIDLRNFFLDPMARTINMGRHKANDAVRRYIMNFDTFQEYFIGSIYDQFGAAKLVKPGGDTNYYQFYTPPEGIDKDNQVEVLWYWGRRPDKLIIIANDVVIRDGPNPYNHKQLPFAEGSDVPRLNQFWAKGEPELLESIQDELTTLRRMRIDRQHMDLWKMFLVNNSETLDDDEAIIAPSRFLYVSDVNGAIRTVDYPDINPSAYREEELLKQDGRMVTGIESPQPAGTATQAAIFKESTMKSLRLKIWLLSRELVTNIIRLRVPNITQYYSEPKVNKILGEKKSSQYRTIRTENVELKMDRAGKLIEEEKRGHFYFEIDPSIITPLYGSFDYKLSGEPSFPVSKPLQQQKAAEFMQHPVIQAAIQSGYYDSGRMADELSDVNDFDPEKFKPVARSSEEEDMQMTEEQLYELANRENELILSGQKVPGTAFATRGHTDIHLAFMGSDRFKDAVRSNPQVLEDMSLHVLWEEKAQQQRATMQQGQMALGAPSTEREGIMSGQMKAMNPGKILGPEETPAGQGAF